MVSTHLKNISQIGNLPQIGVKIKNVWNHHPVNPLEPSCWKVSQVPICLQKMLVVFGFSGSFRLGILLLLAVFFRLPKASVRSWRLRGFFGEISYWRIRIYSVTRWYRLNRFPQANSGWPLLNDVFKAFLDSVPLKPWLTTVLEAEHLCWPHYRKLFGLLLSNPIQFCPAWGGIVEVLIPHAVLIQYPLIERASFSRPSTQLVLAEK